MSKLSELKAQLDLIRKQYAHQNASEERQNLLEKGMRVVGIMS